jgi:ATP-dependent RNA helicase DbpA
MTTTSDFSSLGLPDSLLEAVVGLGFNAMTEVQARTLPSTLAGRDLVVQAEPGSGKTLAFGLGMLAAALPHLPPALPEVRALVVCPTRELAEQIAAEVRRLARRTPNVKVLVLCGGVPFRPQRDSLKQGAHVVVGTPGRLEEHLRKSSLRLDALEVLVLDEADRMLTMGFAPQIEAVTSYAPPQRQTLLFSATMPDEIAELGRKYQRDPEHVIVEPAPIRMSEPPPVSASADAGAPQASQNPASGGGFVEMRYHRVEVRDRVSVLARWLALEQPASTLVFSNTRTESASVAEELRRLGWVATSIHGEMSQRDRAHVMRLFANGSCPVLVATDVAARGWDIGGLSAVVNLGLPRDPSVHLHRVGRTGRAGESGQALHFVAEEDRLSLATIERYQGRTALFSTPPSARQPLPAPAPPKMVTLLLAAGKNKKLRPGDILGALTAEGGVSGSDVGLIHIDESSSYVAVASAVAEQALAHLQATPIKGKTIKVLRAGLSLSAE